MSLSGEFIPEDKIESKPLAQGSRVHVHRLHGHSKLDGRVLRIPREPFQDSQEVRQMEMLRQGPLAAFLPDPEVIRAKIGGQVRNLVTSLEVRSPLCRVEPNAGSFAYELQTRGPVDAQILYLEQMRKFIDACKNAYWQFKMLPDLIGKGNLVSDRNGIWLLDFNNISGQWTIGPEVQVPLDDQGLPIFDMGLQLLHRIEKRLLTRRGNNFSTEAFNRAYRQERKVEGNEIPREFEGTLVDKDQLKVDPFYGALRFGARRQKVAAILDRITRERMPH